MADEDPGVAGGREVVDVTESGDDVGSRAPVEHSVHAATTTVLLTMPTTVIDGVSIASGGTESGTHPIANAGRGDEWTYFVRADADGADLTVTFEAALAGGGPYHALVGTDEANVDATDGVALVRNIGAGEEVQVSVANNGAAASTVTVEAERTRR